MIFYLYVDDMPAYRQQLIERGVQVGEVTHPFWSPGGEFRVDVANGVRASVVLFLTGVERLFYIS